MHTIDLSEKKNTLANKINKELSPKISSLNFDEIKSIFLGYVDDDSLYISQERRNKYHKEIESQKNLLQLQSYIYNVVLRSSGMGVY